MIRKWLYKYSPAMSLLPFSIDEDRVSPDSEIVKQMYKERSGDTGRDRLYYMFTVDEFGNLSPELTSTFQVGFMGLLIGSVYGGFTHSRIAYLDFMENNQATKFKSHFEAKKKLQDTVTINFGKGAFKWGWRLGIFSTSYVLITTAISVYRGKSSILEYLVGGGVTGTLYKFTAGPKAMIVGGGLGTFLGAIAGGLSLSILKLTGISMEDMRYWQYRFQAERDEKFREAIKKHKAKEDSQLFREYSARKENVKINLDILDENDEK